MSGSKKARGGVGGAAAAPATRDRLVRLLTPADVADLICVSEATLERWRGQGGGPPFARLAAKVIRYRGDDILDFINSRVVTSTAQAGG